MKKCNKLISTILAIIMVLSTVSVSFVSFAAEAKEDVILSTVEDMKNGKFDLFDVINKALGGVATGIDKINEKINEAKASDKTVAPKTETATPKVEAPAGKATQIAPFAAADYPEGTDPKVIEFSNMLAGFSEPYTNDKWAPIAKFYSDNKSLITSKWVKADRDLYNKLVRAPKTFNRSTDAPDLSTYKQTLVVYPFGITNANVSNVLQGGETVILKIADLLLRDQLGIPEGQDLLSFLRTKAFSGETISLLLGALFPILKDTLNMTGNTTKDVASYINVDGAEPLYESARAKIAAIPFNGLTEEDKANGLTLKDVENATFKQVQLTSADFGFVDGDKEAFTNALLSVFRPATMLLALLLGNPLLNKMNRTTGYLDTGAYEHIIPIFEALDIDGLMTPQEYAEYQKTGTTVAAICDNMLKPVISPVVDLVEDLLESPMMVILEKLPLICNAIDSGFLNERLSPLVTAISGGLFKGEIKMTTETVYDLINGALKDIKISDTVSITINLNKAKFMKTVAELAGCADAAQYDSISEKNAYRLGLKGRQGDAFVVLFRGLCAQLKTSKNSTAVLKAIDNSDATRTEKFAAKVSVVAMSTLPTDLALYAIAG